jgi:DNA-binding transcriptional ArsR family regulator
MPPRHVLSPKLVERIAERFRVLGDPMRVSLIENLRAGEATVSTLTARTGGSQQNISKHLSVLHVAGIVARRRDGARAFYRLVDSAVLELCAIVCESLGQPARTGRRALAQRGRDQNEATRWIPKNDSR